MRSVHGLARVLTVLAALLCAWPVLAVAADEAVLPAELTATKLPTDAELDGAWARVQLRANPGPFQYLAYELTSRGPAGVISHVRGYMGRTDVVTRTELLSKADLRRVMGYLRDLGALQLAPVPPPAEPKGPVAKSKGKATPPIAAGDEASHGPRQSSVPIFELSFRLGEQDRTLLVTDPDMLADRRYARFIEVLRLVALRVAGPIAYEGPAGSAGQAGYLFIDSSPSAEVSLDGVPLGETTPVFAHPTSPGNHTILLENKRLDLRREVKVKVQSGLTTSVELELP